MTPIRFYHGVVRHRRMTGPKHALRHRVSYVCVDLDRFEEANAASMLLGVGRPGLISIDAKDHGDGKSGDLAGWVRATLRRQGVDKPAKRIELLAMPKLFGFVFNPISVYFIHDGDDRLHHILYEVNNTFGGRHFYLVAADAPRRVHKHQCDKAFYVSPFFDVDGYYDFKTGAPDDDVRLAITYRDPQSNPAMVALFAGARGRVSNAACLKTLLRFPLMTIGVVAAIHWQALILLFKGARMRDARGLDHSFETVSRERGGAPVANAAGGSA